LDGFSIAQFSQGAQRRAFDDRRRLDQNAFLNRRQSGQHVQPRDPLQRIAAHVGRGMRQQFRQHGG
jgi:hypothetical protein